MMCQMIVRVSEGVHFYIVQWMELTFQGVPHNLMMVMLTTVVISCIRYNTTGFKG